MIDILLRGNPQQAIKTVNETSGVWDTFNIIAVILGCSMFLFIIIRIIIVHEVFAWQLGRQTEVVYEKLRLIKIKIFRFGMDMYILRYDPFIHLPKHKDNLPGGKHYRLNIQLKGKGYFYIDKVIFRIKNKVIFFRPDIYPHSMINGATRRYVLSIGFGFFKKHKKY